MAQRIEDALLRLQSSNFRARFHLSEKDRQYIDEKGLDTIRKHAEDFVSKRLAPDVIENDGKQTPMRQVHPVFIAQHACGCCCRGCLERIHHIPKNKELSKSEIDYIVEVIMTWIKREITK